MSKKSVLVVLLAVVFLLSFAACGQATPEPSGSVEVGDDKETPEDTSEATDEPIRVGVCAVLSGTNAAHGEFYTQGVELWKDQVNESGGILGRQVEIVYEDSGETEQSRVNAVVKALTEDNVIAVMTDYDSSNNILCSPEIEKYGIPYFGCASSASVLALGNPYLWFNRMTDAQLSPSMVNACKELLEMKKPAIIYVNDAFGQGLYENVKKAIENDPDMEVAIEISTQADEKQYAPFLTQIINSGADGIIALHHQEQAALVMKQIDAMGIDVPKMGCSQYATALAFETAGESSNGWYSLADWSDETQNPKGLEFLAAYRERHNANPDFMTVCAYDAGIILQDAIIRANSTDPEEINNAIKETSGLQGAMAVYTYTGGPQTLAETINLTETVDQSSKLIDIVNR